MGEAVKKTGYAMVLAGGLAVGAVAGKVVNVPSSELRHISYDVQHKTVRVTRTVKQGEMSRTHVVAVQEGTKDAVELKVLAAAKALADAAGQLP